MKVHKTKTLAVKYECSACSTIFRKEDINRTSNHPGLGKFTVQPDVEGCDCPFCGETQHLDTAEIITYPAPVARNKEIAGLIRRKYQLEKKVEQASSERVRAEDVGIVDNNQGYDGGFDGDVGELRHADSGAVASRANAQNVIFESILALTTVNDALSKRTGNAPVPKHLPRSMGQNCHSGGVTIKEQVNWKFWDAWLNPALRPFPVELPVVKG